MGPPELLALLPDASQALRDILDASPGPDQPPIRAEIFGPQRFAQHGRSLGETHRAAKAGLAEATFFPRLRSNISVLRAAHHYISVQAAGGYDVSPAAEWLLDNFHLIEAQLKEIHEGLPRSYFRTLPVLLDEPLAGLPRIYGVAWAFVAHTDGAFDEDLLVQFLRAYQETRALDLREMWALPTTLRVVLIENLRRLAEHVAIHKAAREAAHLCCDRIDSCTPASLDRVRVLLDQRGVGQVFAAQVGQRLQDRRSAANTSHGDGIDQWLQQVLPDPAAMRAQQGADQTADNLSVSNAVTSLRAIGDADWPDIVARSSALMQRMLTSPMFEAEHVNTRDQTLHGIERLAQRSGRTELDVAQTLLDLMHDTEGADPACGVAEYWLRGLGRPTLMQSLGLRDNLGLRLAHAWHGAARRLALPAYLCTLLLGTLALAAWMLRPLFPHGAYGLVALGALEAAPWWSLLAAVLILFPASEAVVAVINRLISESAHPEHLPRLALPHGIPPEHRVLVVVPALLGDAASIERVVHRLQLHYLANPEPQAQFALLSDWSDADSAHLSTDDDQLQQALRAVSALNSRYPMPAAESVADAANGPAPAPRFIVLHRQRQFSPTEQRWIGWERKRGKLELLVAALATGDTGAFLDLGEASRLAPYTPYVVTLDSDTHLPPGRLRELVGVAAHPHNLPQLDALGRSVVSGYGILQPRVVTPLPAPHEFTLYQWLFAGQCGIDPYSAASSEVYQDLFFEGTFTGKGLLNVQAMQAVLNARLPDGLVLSHDLLEGALARCATVTDITLVEDAPFHADVAASRVHRWTRGDWQLLPFLLPFLPHSAGQRLSAINRWKMSDNLRRSLVAPMSLALLLLALLRPVVSPWAALALVLAAYAAGPLMGALAGLIPSHEDLAKRHFYRKAATELARALWGGLWRLGQLLQQALMDVDAIVRALWRMGVSHRHLLQWTTAAAAQAAAKTRLGDVLRVHWSEPVVALLLLGALLAADTPAPVLATLLCLLWASAPVSIWWVSRARLASPDTFLPVQDQAYLEGIARDTWRFFERCVGPDDRHLPPDNLQVLPHDMVAHRTSPTNIGLYLLSSACAREFGWIGTQDLIVRVQATLSTLATLARHRGHFLNWYDTQTGAPLLPMYVSTVDSGNLSGHLLAVAQACVALALAPHDTRASGRALRASEQRLAPLLPQWSALLPSCLHDSALARLLAMADPLGEGQHTPLPFEQLLRDAAAELAQLQPLQTEATGTTCPGPRDELIWCLGDHLATLGSAWRDLQAHAVQDPAFTSLRLQSLARECEQLAGEADFSFLYHPKRHLLHIGFRVAEQQLDAGFYDLLASESRLTSLLAIAKGDVPVRHWASLGRPFFAVGAEAGLRSWSGSMFEYLMPTLVLDEPAGSVLSEACHAALQEQIGFTAEQALPWGLSESAYAGRDHTLAYQYSPQGVPRLALRRTPPGELVIAPYATALAAQVSPHRACLNFRALEARSARGHYGFIEALDFSPARQADAELCTPVGTFMSHHQGMSIVALANVLLDGVAQRWGMANAQIEAVVSLLHERAPREVSTLYEPPAGPALLAAPRGAPGMLREVLPGLSAVEPTHLLSNGRYHVALRANGAGSSRWGAIGITRQRDDALRDACGSFFYLRRGQQPLVSLTQHPAPDPQAHYKSTFHADRVCFDAAWADVQTRITAWVSPEDDIEFRQIDLHNLSDEVLEIELISAFELTLSDPRADEAHPAFTNLFVQSRWQPAHEALLFERTPRLASEAHVQAAHFLADGDPQLVSLGVQADRARWCGRNRGPSQPLASFDSPPVADAATPDAALPLHTGLDPVCALSMRLRIAPQGKAQLTLATVASNDGATLRAVIDKYRQPSHLQRASLMSATLTGIRLRDLRLDADSFAGIQVLTSALVQTLTRPQLQPGVARGDVAVVTACDRRLLWRFGISGDRPIVLVTASMMQGMAMLRTLGQALRLWAWGGVHCDLVVVNAEPPSYHMPMQHELAALHERHDADSAAQAGTSTTGLHVLRADEISADELSTLRQLARLQFHADGRPLLRHIEEWVLLHELAEEEQHDTSTSAPGKASEPPATVAASTGAFDARSGEFRFEVSARRRPQRPWINVLANAGFGAQLSETGGGYTWAGNSRMNQLTAWSNDPLGDPPSEWFLVQDLKTLQVWSVAPSAWGDELASHQVAHGQGYSRISHRRGDVEITATWCVDAANAVKQVQLQLTNRGSKSQHLRLIGLAEWMMGAQRSDRGSVHTAAHRQRLPGMAITAVLCTQRERSAGFGGGTAFLALAGPADEPADWTCDRRECFDARGRLVVPDHFGQLSGSGLDPCAALASRVLLAAGESAERSFLLGFADSPDAARQLATVAAAVPAAQRLAQVRQHWDQLLGATQVRTPDPLFDAMVNRWLLYQTVSCRLWAKAGFYQAGGATGFRDQLQDALALAWAAPALLREQIVLCASRQFAEGDVQHWWHAPLGAGVRTHFSDDLLWLPYACVHYLRATADNALLDQSVAFIEGATIAEGAEDVYDTPVVSMHHASVYEHAARTIDRSLKVGVHGLPLMGTGDWNDGMNRVGHGGRGESVWLGWFLCQVVADFAPLARERGEAARAQQWEQAAQGWKAALLGPAWDGEWFKRAFFDDGQALGSHANPEARIDLIAQAWAVLSRVAPLEQQGQALAALEAQLVDPQAGLIKLLAPPLVHAEPSAGYIQAYPPGVRENGGQYSHAGVWALMAQAQHDVAASVASGRGMVGSDAGGDTAYRYFTYLSPAHRAAHAVRGAAYGIEPYVVAGDVYSQPPYVGRGGWSWYTGAAAWLHRSAIESLFGLHQHAHALCFAPSLPAHWPHAELTLRRDGRTLRFILLRAPAEQALAMAAALAPGQIAPAPGARLLQPGELLAWAEQAPHSCFVIPLPGAGH
jgi:cyclic beta-1,2-glucan synthetase